MPGERNKRYICIHGHFYQPPRENPWLEEVCRQDSALPFHDWNQRIHKECYAANLNSPVIDSLKKTKKAVNSYRNISFNFGPTLLSWLKKHHPDTHKAIIESDRYSRRRFSGHGSGIAQCYNHIIMPLANYRDKRTQAIWGISDFRSRFRRKPEGMWLPETAVDLGTLDILAAEGIRFTILAPHQAEAVRKIGERRWQSVSKQPLDTTTPYLCRLPTGKTISVFFYDRRLSHDIAFGNLLDDGELLTQSLLSAFDGNSVRCQLVSVAVDGETFGHHHRFGNMALAYCVSNLSRGRQVKITNYGEYLEKFPPVSEVKIQEQSSWSCSHGIERWRADCGCNSGMNQGWRQTWRPVLRRAMDWLRDELITVYESKMPPAVKDSWKMRDDYILLVLDRSPDNIAGFFRRHLKNNVSRETRAKILMLLEMQRNAMLMYTSCGWFFDDISGIEAVQVMQFAARAIELAEKSGSRPLENRYTGLLKKAKSNIPQINNGFNVYRRFVTPEKYAFKEVNRLFDA